MEGPQLMLSVEDKSKVVKASWLVQDAFRGFSRAHPKATPQAVQTYKIYHRLVSVRQATVFILLMLTFVETPHWCHGAWPHPCGDPMDPATPLTSGMLLLARGKSVLVEVVCLVFCLVNDGLLYHSLGRNFFTRFDRYVLRHPQVVIASCCSVCALGLFCVALANALVRFATAWPLTGRIAPFLRLFIFTLTFRSIRSTYRKMYLVMAEVHNIMSLVAMYVGFFAWLATVLFQDTDEAGVMRSFTESAWQLLILLTTANFPDIMMPAYTKNRAYGLFFIVFVAFGLFFMMNLILAQVFNNFQRIAASDEAKAEKNRTALLTQAFDVLVTIQSDRHQALTSRIQPGSPSRGTLRHSPTKAATSLQPVETVQLRAPSPPKRQQVGSTPLLPPLAQSSPVREEPVCTWIDTDLALALFHELNHYNVASTRLTHKHMLELFHQLDTDGDGRIQLDDFFAVCDCMREYVQTYHKAPSEIERWWPHVAASPRYQHLCAVVQHRRFEVAVDALLVLNAVCIVLETSSGSALGTSSSADDGRPWEIVQIVFSSLYVVEMLLKIVVHGWRDYVHYFRNRFDGVITVVSLAVDIYADLPNEFSSHTVPKVLMTFRCVRMLRLFLSIERYRVILHTAWAMVPIGKNLLLVMFCNMNVFALVGHQLFGGRISPALLETDLFANSTYAASGYAANNFNDVPSGMVTLFELLVVNNWFVIVEGHVLVTTVWARLFFVAFWLTGVIMTLNLIVASILDAFSKEYAAAAASTTPAATANSPSKFEIKSFVLPPTSPSRNRVSHQRMVAFPSARDGANADLFEDDCRSA